jgi:hypothetical protein
MTKGETDSRKSHVTDPLNEPLSTLVRGRGGGGGAEEDGDHSEP